MQPVERINALLNDREQAPFNSLIDSLAINQTSDNRRYGGKYQCRDHFCQSVAHSVLG